MSSKALGVVAIVIAIAGLRAESALAKTVVVGTDATCQPDVEERYSTIQAAVDAMTIGGTVLICPGTYPEQVVINQPMDLEGVTSSNNAAIVITVPSGGLIPNVSSPTYGNESAQLLLQNFDNGRSTIQNVVIDGGGATCPTSAPGGATRTVGIKLLNVGDSTWTSSAAIIRNVVVRNQVDGCGLGEGVDSENSYITVENSTIRDIERNGIVAVGGDTFFNNNSMHNVTQWGIWMSGGVNSIISNNTLSTQRGILLDSGTAHVEISDNAIGPFTGTGILLIQVDAINIKNNKVNGSYAGIWLYRASNTMVTGNSLNHMYGFGIVNEASSGGNWITTNTITDAPKGVVLYNSNASVDTLSPNAFAGVVAPFSTTPW